MRENTKTTRQTNNIFFKSKTLIHHKKMLIIAFLINLITKMMLLTYQKWSLKKQKSKEDLFQLKFTVNLTEKFQLFNQKYFQKIQQFKRNYKK